MKRIAIISANELYEIPLSQRSTIRSIEKSAGQNLGNFAFTYPITKLIDADCCHLGWDFDVDYVNSNFDGIWFACANMLGPHADLGWVSEKLEKVKIPIIAVGLGAQSPSIQTKTLEIPHGSLNWLNVLSEHSFNQKYPNIFCRGSYTDSFIKSKNLSNSVAGCCPSLLTSNNLQLGDRIATAFRQNPSPPIICYSGFIGNKPLYRLEQSLFEIVKTQAERSIYCSQHGSILLGLSDQILFEQLSVEEITKAIEMLCEGTDLAEFRIVCKRFFRSFYSFDEWFGYLAANIGFSTGMRFHGNMIATQAGIPALFITLDSRTEEMCRSSCVAYVNAWEFKSLSLDLCRSIFDVRFSAVDFDSNRYRMASAFCEFLSQNGLSPSKHLLRLAQECLD